MITHESSHYRPGAMSSTAPSSNTWDGEEAGELTKKKSWSHARRLIPRIIIASFFLLIFVAVIVTGVLFDKSVKKTENRHSLQGYNINVETLGAPISGFSKNCCNALRISEATGTRPITQGEREREEHEEDAKEDSSVSTWVGTDFPVFHSFITETKNAEHARWPKHLAYLVQVLSKNKDILQEKPNFNRKIQKVLNSADPDKESVFPFLVQNGRLTEYRQRNQHSCYRQINTAWRRKLCGGQVEDVSDDVANAVQALQGSHSRGTDENLYGRSPDALLGISEDIIFLFLEASVDWQKVLRVVPGGLGLPYFEARRSQFSSLERKGVITMGRKASHKQYGDILNRVLQTQEAILERLSVIEVQLCSKGSEPDADITMVEPDPVKPPTAVLEDSPRPKPKISQPRTGSKPTGSSHSEPGSNSRTPASAPSRAQVIDLTLSPSPPPKKASSSSSSNRAGTVTVRDVLKCLRKLLGPKAMWRDQNQYDGVRALLALERDVVVSSGTGSGKSIIAIVPTMVENAHTLLVTPLKSLMDDWERRLQDFGLGYERWKGAENPHLVGDHNIILVSAGMAATETFKDEVALRNVQRPVVRWVFDESHHYAIETGFRKEAFATPEGLCACFDAQMVLMSATTSAPALAFLTDQFFLKSPLRICRVTDRVELNICITEKCEDLPEQIEVVRRKISQLVAQKDFWEANSRYLIFVNTHREGNDVVDALGLEFYRADSDDHPIADEERIARYKRWQNSAKLGMVASPALSKGTDYPNVRATFHIGVPYNITLFTQQRGRAGRDRKLAFNYVIPLLQARRPTIAPEQDLAGIKTMYEFVYGGAPHPCRTYQITAFFEDKRHTCEDLGRANPCEPCEFICVRPGSPTLPMELDTLMEWSAEADKRQLKRKLKEVFGDSTERAVLKAGNRRSVRTTHLLTTQEFLHDLGTSCGYCYALGAQNRPTHEPSECLLMNSNDFSEFKRAMSYRGSGGVCFNND
ncbi:hypothetical protein B0H19DRAFT_1078169 [Mycena capillaripes]|nr:hypothetical protein B0H19DRAFT_1078169 [Mycena capillaripes]